MPTPNSESFKYFNPVVLLAGTVGLFQSVTWFILSLLGILAHRCLLLPPKYEQDTQFANALVKLYFEGYDCKVTGFPLVDKSGKAIGLDLNVYPSYLHGWMAAYLTMNILYFGTSFCILWYKNRPGSLLTNWVRAWSALTLAFLIMDLTLTIQFGDDFGRINSQLSGFHLSDTLGWLNSVPGALFTIAARGFVLWLLNLALLVYFLGHVVNWMALCPTPNAKVELDFNDPQVIEAIDAYNRSNVDNSTWKHNDRALVPINYDFNKGKIPRAWEDHTYPRHHPNAVEGTTRFGEDDDIDLKPLPRTQRPIIWDEDDAGPSTGYKPRPRDYVYKAPTDKRQRDNHGFLDDDNQPRTSVVGKRQSSDFAHNIRNFEQGRGIPKNGNGKPFGAPVRMPPPPAMPKADSHYY